MVITKKSILSVAFRRRKATDSIAMKLTIYKNGVFVEDHGFTYSDQLGPKTEVLNYKAN